MGGVGGEQALLSGASSRDWEKGSLESKSKRTGCRVATGFSCKQRGDGPFTPHPVPSVAALTRDGSIWKGESVLYM